MGTQSWRAEFDNATASTPAVTALAKITCLETWQLHQPPCSKCKGSQCQCGATPQLFLTLTAKSFEQVRRRVGIARHVGRPMPPEVPKSWSYLQYAWNACALTPVTSAIESITDGDEN